MEDEKLWDEWGSHYQRNGVAHKICRDGIVNTDLFQKACIRALFVMREANMKGQDDAVDLRKLFYEKPWSDPGRWAAGILAGFPPYTEVDAVLSAASFRSIAVINLKKASGGTGTADPSVINAYAWLDRELLRRQIRSIDPKIIIACGTFDALIWLLDLRVNPDHPARPLDSPSGIHVVPFRHPSQDPRRERTYNRLRTLLDPQRLTCQHPLPQAGQSTGSGEACAEHLRETIVKK
jgi:hypothetical protein